MKKVVFLFLLVASVASAQGFNPGIPLPGLPKSVGPKPMSGSTSVTFATDQTGLAITGTVSVTGTVSSSGKIPFTLVRNNYVTNPVSMAAYTQLVAGTSEPTTALDIFDSSGSTLALAYGAAGVEVNKIYIYPGGNGLVPVSIPQNTRVSVIAISPTASSGELDINFYD